MPLIRGSLRRWNRRVVILSWPLGLPVNARSMLQFQKRFWQLLSHLSYGGIFLPEEGSAGGDSGRGAGHLPHLLRLLCCWRCCLAF